MSINTSASIMIYGGSATGDQPARAATNPTVQKIGELLAVATYGRRARGPRKGGRFSLHGAMTGAAGAGSALTIGYSNLMDPDPTVDGDWVDSGIAPIVLTSTTPFMSLATDRLVEWVRYKVVIGTTSGSLWLYHLAEGREAA